MVVVDGSTVVEVDESEVELDPAEVSDDAPAPLLHAASASPPTAVRLTSRGRQEWARHVIRAP